MTAKPGFVVAVWDRYESRYVSIAVSARRERLERLFARLELVSWPVVLLEASSLSEDDEEAALREQQGHCDDHVRLYEEMQEHSSWLDEWLSKRVGFQ